MRILLALPYPGFLRYFDATIRSLAERGHEVELWFDQRDKQAEALDVFPGHCRVVVRGRLPKRRDPWARAALAVREVTDIARYLDPAFAGATYLRRRGAERLPRHWRLLARLPTLPQPAVRRLLKLLRTIEATIPRGPVFDDLLEESSPDVVLCSPLVMWASRQADLVHSAGARGIPTAALIASWDNLTTKGLLRVLPDRVVVWNELQAAEAADLHLVPRSRIIVTGAQPFDRWFSRSPTRDRAAFCERVGLPANRPYVLFVGSTASISAPDAERDFVRGWARTLRASRNPLVSRMPILVRPHPYNSGHWEASDLADVENAVVYPLGGANPVDEGDRDDYFDSIYHSSAVVGINTSAMLEAAVIGRAVLTVTVDEFADTQMGTLHFRYLIPDGGGVVHSAYTVDEHLAQLAAVLDDVSEADRLRSFVSSFVRPHGLDRPVTPILVETIEEIARVQPSSGQRRPGRATRVVILSVMLLPGPARWLVSELWKRASWKLRRRRRAQRARRSAVPPRLRPARNSNHARRDHLRILRLVRHRARVAARGR